MGGCSSTAGPTAWTAAARAESASGGASMQLVDVLTDRQVQLVRDTWDLIVIRDTESECWSEAFYRYADKNKDLIRLFSFVESANNLHRLSPSTSPTSKLSCRNGEHQVGSGTEDQPFTSSPGVNSMDVAGDDAVNISQCAAAAYREAEVVIGSESTVRRHAQFVMETLGAAVECLDLDDSSVFGNILVALGQIHATYDVKQHHLSLFWATIHHSLRECVGPEAFTAEVDHAWQALFAYVIARMRSGIRIHRQIQYDGHFCSDGVTNTSTCSGPSCSL